MKFRVGHEVRHEIIVEAANSNEAQEMAAHIPYPDWDHQYVTIEDCIPIDESPVNPQAE
jgi:hypothetical protein